VVYADLIVKTLSEPRSYLIIDEKRRILRKNSKWIKEIFNNEIDFK